MLDILNKSPNKNNNVEDKNLVKITALLIHAAKIDDNYSDKERLIIISFSNST